MHGSRERMQLWPGQPYPLGATPVDGSVNFGVVSEGTDRPEIGRPATRQVEIDTLAPKPTTSPRCAAEPLRPGIQRAIRSRSIVPLLSPRA